jgi:hypothetical protein
MPEEFVAVAQQIQVQCSRRINESDLQAKTNECLRAARQGAVLVSPDISKGEKGYHEGSFQGGSIIMRR